MIKLYLANKLHTAPPLGEVEQWKFPAGEVGVRLPTGVSKLNLDDKINVSAIIRNSDDVMALLLSVNALKSLGLHNLGTLLLPYVPYARQDRICNEGESLSIQVMAQLVNSCGFQRVAILDPHSTVTPALINNVQVFSPLSMFHNIFRSWENITLLAPDIGAAKRVEAFAKEVGAKDVVVANKTRNLRTGEITGYDIDLPMHIEHAVVLDDICDGGRTFVELHKHVAYKCDQLDLIVSHGIFSKGVEVVAELYDTVYTTNSFFREADIPTTIDNVVVREVV